MPDDLSPRSHWERVYESASQPHRNPSRLRRFARAQLSRKFDTVLERFFATIEKPGGNVLELGCAPGRFIEHMHGLHAEHRFCGVDYAQKTIRATERRLCEAGIEAEIHCGDIRDIELPVKFDLVVSFGLIEHFADPVPILRDHVRFCVPGGCVGVTVPNLSEPIVEKVGRRFAPETMSIHNLKIMNVDAVKAALEAAGLENVHSGGAGGPRFSEAVEPGKRFGGVYRRAARTWNLAVAVLPFDFLWHQTFWGLGRVPEATDDR